MMVAAMMKNPVFTRMIRITGTMNAHTNPVPGFKKQLERKGL